MTRIVQSAGNRGSQKWLQIAVNDRPDVINRELNGHSGIQGKIQWLSPLRTDEYAEYRDSAFLDLIGCSALALELAAFWPKRGPQWDALARTDRDEVLLVEAKAHISEIFSPPSGAGPESRAKIDAALSRTASYLNSKQAISWGVHFYQLTNRLTHLHFLRKHNVNASLVLLNFLGDSEMGGPETAAEWDSAYAVAWHVLGLSSDHKLSKYVLHGHVDVRALRT